MAKRAAHDGLLDRLDRAFVAIARILRGISIYVGIPAILAVVTVDVGSRTLFNAPILGANEISSSLLLIVFVGCLPSVSQHNRHIRMDLVYDRLGGRAQRAADLASAGCGVFLYGLLAWEAGHRIQDILRYDEVTQLMQLPLWPLALVLLACSVLVVAIELLRAFRGPGETADPDGDDLDDVADEMEGL